MGIIAYVSFFLSFLLVCSVSFAETRFLFITCLFFLVFICLTKHTGEVSSTSRLIAICHQGQSSSSELEQALILLSGLKDGRKSSSLLSPWCVMRKCTNLRREPCFLRFSFVCIITGVTRPTPVRLTWLGLRSKTPARFGQRNSFSFPFPWTIPYFLFFSSAL